MMEGLILMGAGAALAGTIGGHLATKTYSRRKIERLETSNAYLTKRNVALRTRVDHAEGKERTARTAQFLAERNHAIAEAQIVVFEAREKDWSRRILATMTEQEQGAV